MPPDLSFAEMIAVSEFVECSSSQIETVWVRKLDAKFNA
jgi:hypothetical protein